MLFMMDSGHKARGRTFPDLKHRQLKEQAIAFYSEHKVQDALETLLNEMFLSEPKDVYGYMSEYFHGLALQPVISSLSVHEGLDVSGGKSLELDLYCTVNGMDKLISSTSFSLDMYNCAVDPQLLSAKGPARRGTPRSRNSHSSLDQGELTSSHGSTASSATPTMVTGVKSVNKHIAPAVKGLSPFLFEEVDQALSALGDAHHTLHPSALLATSCVTVMAGAQLTNTPLFLHLAKMCRPPPPHSADQSQPSTPTKTKRSSQSRQKSRRRSSNPAKFTMPVPIVAALSGGQLGCGKCRIREFCVSPLPGAPFSEQIRMMVAVHKELGKCLAGKYGPSGQGCLVSGAYCPVIDKPEQALDFIQEAAKNAGFELNQGIAVIVDVGAERLYDEEKGKYELIAGQWKSTDDIINIYADLHRSYPGLLGFVDPLHHQDIEGWKKLQEKLGNSCFLIADNTLQKGLPIRDPNNLTESVKTISEEVPSPDSDQTDQPNQIVEEDKPCLSYLSCGTITLQTTLSGTMCQANHIKGHSYYVILRVPPNCTMNTLPADLAVAMMCRFIRMGAPTGLTSSGILGRLIRIREELVSRKLHDPAGAHVITSTPESMEIVHE